MYDVEVKVGGAELESSVYDVEVKVGGGLS